MYFLDTPEIVIALVTKIEDFVSGAYNASNSNTIKKYAEDSTSELLKDLFKGPVSEGCFKLFNLTINGFQKLTTELKPDVNADLQRAIRRSCLKATVFACQQLISQKQGDMQIWEKRTQSILTQRINAFNRYIKKTKYNILPLDLQTHSTSEDVVLNLIIDYKKKLQFEIDKTRSASYELPASAANFQFDKLVPWDHVQPVKEYFEDLRNQMLDEVLREIVDQFPSAPDQLGKIIRNGWRVGSKVHSWFDEVTREFENEIKHNQAVSNIYQAKIITDVKTDIGKITLKLASYEEHQNRLEGLLIENNSEIKQLGCTIHEEFISLQEFMENLFSLHTLKQKKLSLILINLVSIKLI